MVKRLMKGSAVAVALVAVSAAPAAAEYLAYGSDGSASWVTSTGATLTRMDVGSSDFTTLGTKWEPGPNAASTYPLLSPPGTPGSATWSIMGAGLGDSSGFDPHGVANTTLDIVAGLGVPGFTLADYIALFDAALDVWDAASGFTNLGMVADGGVGRGASQASGGHLGDIRVGALVFDGLFGVLAHNYQPGTEAIFGAGGTIAGDSHYDSDETWVDEAGDAGADADFDLFTVALHEFGHALGLGHSAVAGSVMFPFYGGGLRTLTADDIAGIVAIYGPVVAPPVPEPATLLLFGAALGGYGWSRRRKKA